MQVSTKMNSILQSNCQTSGSGHSAKADMLADNWAACQSPDYHGGLRAGVRKVYVWHEKPLQRSKTNFSSISSMSIRSELIGSCVIRMRTCSSLTTSRWREFSNLSSKETNSGICKGLLSRKHKSVKKSDLTVLFWCECANDEIRGLWTIREGLTYRNFGTHILGITDIDLTWFYTFWRVCQVPSCRKREGQGPCEKKVGKSVVLDLFYIDGTVVVQSQWWSTCKLISIRPWGIRRNTYQVDGICVQVATESGMTYDSSSKRIPTQQQRYIDSFRPWSLSTSWQTHDRQGSRDRRQAEVRLQASWNPTLVPPCTLRYRWIPIVTLCLWKVPKP